MKTNHKTKINNILRAFAAILIACGSLFISYGNSRAASLRDLQSQQSDINQQIRDNKEKVEEAEGEIYQISGEIETLEGNISTTESKISDLEGDITRNEEEIRKTEEEIAEKERLLDNEFENQKEALRTIYEAQKYSSPVRMIVGASTLSQLLNYNTYLEALEEKIEASIDEITKIRNELEDKKSELDDQKKDLQSLREQEKAYKRGLEDQKSTKDELLDDKEAEKMSLEEQIAEAKEMQSQVEAQIQSLMIAATQANNGQTVIARDRGVSDVGFMWPADYQYISAYYSEPTPFQSSHSGIDLANIPGTPIYASGSGTVTTAAAMQVDGHYYAYGNYIIIGHNARFSSLYGHLQSFAVSVGDEVEQGQIIGYMGNTGWSTGPHLHFEIREYGNHVNPINYLP